MACNNSGCRSNDCNNNYDPCLEAIREAYCTGCRDSYNAGYKDGYNDACHRNCNRSYCDC